MSQLLEWTGEFGRAYTDRNVVDPASRIDGFKAMLGLGAAEQVLEIGGNKGHNALALHALGYRVTSIEPQQYARDIAKAAGVNVWPGDIYSVPFKAATFDIVFTCGVLIHVPPDSLDRAMQEVVRVSRRYVLAIEYAAAEDTEVVYRGRAAMMWNRDYGAHYARHGLTLLETGVLGAEFDRATFWLLEKLSADRS